MARKYELAWIENGELFRGGVPASLATVGKWIESCNDVDPETIYVAVPVLEETENG